MLSNPPWVARFAMVMTAIIIVVGFIILMANTSPLPMWPWFPLCIAVMLVGAVMVGGAFSDLM